MNKKPKNWEEEIRQELTDLLVVPGKETQKDYVIWKIRNLLQEERQKTVLKGERRRIIEQIRQEEREKLKEEIIKKIGTPSEKGSGLIKKERVKEFINNL